MTWWQMMLVGLPGPVVITAGAVVVFVLTVRSERERDRIAASDRDRDQRNERLHLACARVCAAATNSALDLQPLGWRSEYLAAFVVACTELAGLILVDHPHVAEWLLKQSEAAGEARETLRQRWWIPGSSSRLQASWGQQLSEISTAVVLWQNGKRDDNWFRDQLPAEESWAETS